MPEQRGATTVNDSILLVDDDPGVIQLLGRILANLGDLRFATNGEDALRLAQESPPDVILLDAEMQGMSGYRVLDSLKARPEMANVPVIFVTAHSEPAFEVSAFEAGAADFISKPIRAALVLARVSTQLRVKRMADQLRLAAATDALTGVANRRKFDQTLEQEWQRSLRGADPLSLLLIDVDHFKLYNDRYGHPKGDEALRLVANALVHAMRRTADVVARCGGEEFGLLLPQTARAGAQHVAQRVLSAVKALDIDHTASPTARHLSVSIGIACYDEESPFWVSNPAHVRFMGEDRRLSCTAPDLVIAADKALYSAKRAGRAQCALQDIVKSDGGSPPETLETSIAGQRRRG
jgi:diguanylate cyclase (GGDEF)-like protein